MLRTCISDTLVRKTRVVESKDPVNYTWKGGRAEPLEAK